MTSARILDSPAGSGGTALRVGEVRPVSGDSGDISTRMTMQLSKLGHGLAVSAVSALVIAGLSMGAAPASAADGAGVRLISQQDGIASVRHRLQRRRRSSAGSVTLTAEQLDPSADDPLRGATPTPRPRTTQTGWTPVSERRRLHQPGAFATRRLDARAPTSSAPTIALRAVAHRHDARPTTYSTRNGVVVTGDDSPGQAGLARLAPASSGARAGSSASPTPTRPARPAGCP